MVPLPVEMQFPRNRLRPPLAQGAQHRFPIREPGVPHAALVEVGEHLLGDRVAEEHVPRHVHFDDGSGVEHGEAGQMVHLGLGLFARGDVRQHDAALLPVLRSRGRELHVLRPLAFIPEGELAYFLRLERECFFQEGLETTPVRLANEIPKPPARQPGAFRPQHARPGQVQLADRPVAAKGHVAHRGKIVELGVALQPRFHLRPRPAQLLILHLQFDLVDLQFVQEAQFFGLCRSTGVGLAGSQPLFCPAALLGGIRRRGLFFFH